MHNSGRGDENPTLVKKNRDGSIGLYFEPFDLFPPLVGEKVAHCAQSA